MTLDLASFLGSETKGMSNKRKNKQIRLREKWNISVLDLWNDAQFNDLTQDERKLYLADAIHPTQAGYKDWWLPKFRDCLCGVLCEE